MPVEIPPLLIPVISQKELEFIVWGKYGTDRIKVSTGTVGLGVEFIMLPPASLKCPYYLNFL